MIVMTRLTFDITNSGLLSPYLIIKAIKPNMYSSKADYFRVFLEVVFVIYIIQENIA